MPITEATLSFLPQGTKLQNIVFEKKLKINDKQRNVGSYLKTASIY
jgi:hypothetical protein